MLFFFIFFFFFSSRRRHTRCGRDWSSDVCSSDLLIGFTSCKKQECKRLKESYEIARTNAEMCIDYSYDENGDPMIVYKDCFNNANSISKIRGEEYLSKCNDGPLMYN